MDELKILGVDANVYFKNIEYCIKNPRKTHFKIFNNTVKFNKEEYADNNKEYVDETLLRFSNATKVVINDDISAIHIMQRNEGLTNLSENLDINHFKPMLDNYVLILPYLGNLFHIVGYWFMKCKDLEGKRNTRVMSFVVQNNKLSFFPVDWIFHESDNSLNDLENPKEIVKQHLIKSFTNHNKNSDTLHKINIEEVLPFYINYVTPSPSLFLRTNLNDKKLDRKIQERAVQRLLNRLSYNQISLLPMYILHIVRNMNDKYQREELKYFDYKDEAVKRNDTDTPFYTYRIVNLNKKILTTTRYERSVNTNKYHEVIGFWRTYKSGKKVWINSQWRGDISRGIIEKDYVS